METDGVRQIKRVWIILISNFRILSLRSKSYGLRSVDGTKNTLKPVSTAWHVPCSFLRPLLDDPLASSNTNFPTPSLHDAITKNSTYKKKMLTPYSSTYSLN